MTAPPSPAPKRGSEPTDGGGEARSVGGPSPPPRGRHRLYQILALIIAVLVGLLAAEGAIRLLDLMPEQRAAMLDGGDDLAGATRESDTGRAIIHPYRGFTPRPGHETTETARWMSHSNLLGIRSLVDDPRMLSDDDLVVGIFGGSVARGTSFRGRQHLTSAMLEVLPEHREQLKIVNFAVSGYKQPQQLYLLSELLLLGVPIDVVVNIDGFNEIALGGTDAIRGHHPLYPEQGFWLATLAFASGSLSPRQIELTADVIRLRRSAAAARDRLRKIPVLRRSAVVQAAFGTSVLGMEARAVEREELLRREHPADLQSAVFSLPDPCIGEDHGCRELIADLWRRSSEQMSALARTSGAAYLHVLQPNQYDAGSKTLSPEELASAWAPHRPWSRAAADGYPLLRRTGQDLSAAGVAYHDLSRIFADRPETIYSDVCCHFNDLGYEIFARRVGQLAADAFLTQISMTPDLHGTLAE